MKVGKKDFRSKELRKRVALLLKKSEKMGIIKSHTEAFKGAPVELEEHKGKLSAYRK